jgi:hypothetical protein
MRDVLNICFLTAGAFIGFTAVASPAQPEPRMFLCPTPAIAAGFWKDLIGISDRGVQINRSIASQVAVQHRCWLATDESQPVAMQGGTMRIGNGGTNDGYVTPDYYVYVQFLTYGLRH